MSKISKYIKIDKNVLMEYVYNDGNLISDPYYILINSKDKKQSYIAYDTSSTNNIKQNQLFLLNDVENTFTKVNTDYYSFLQLKNYSASMPIRHDILKFHLPINWTFGEYYGFYIRVYGFDRQNNTEYEISNFYFDMTDIDQQYLLNFSSPPLLFQEKLWGKSVSVYIPALSDISSQLTNNIPTENSLNSNLTSSSGFNNFSPTFIEFYFIDNIKTINSIKTFRLSSPIKTTIPQTPEYEKLGLKIENSANGDFFEIYGTYNGTISEFKKFIDNAYYTNNRYYVNYTITVYEQNIRGRSTTITITDGFNEPIEYRPIIKYSTTTAIIDVEMRLIDSIDDSYILRRASYGMLQDEVSKYSLNLMKINLKNAYKPKIYNIKTSINPELVGISNSFGIIPVKSDPKSKPTSRISVDSLMGTNNSSTTETIKVPYPVLIDRFNIMAKSENSIIDSKNFYGFGKIQILLYPFDNIIGFTIATGTKDSPKMMDLSNYNDINFIIKNDSKSVEFSTYSESNEIDLSNGIIVFKLSQSKFNDIKKIYNSGINIFYIIGKTLSVNNVIYTGLYKIYDDVVNVTELNDTLPKKEDTSTNISTTETKDTIIVTKRKLTDDARLTKKSDVRTVNAKDIKNNSNL